MTGERRPGVARDRWIIALVYTIAWGALLLNRGLYWDDWVLFGESPGGLVRMYSELGLPWGSPLYVAFFATPLPGWVAHVFAFLVYLGSTYVLHAILLRVPMLTRTDALIAALAFAVLPVNFARIAVIDQMYGLSLLAFLVATWLLLTHLETGSWRRRIAALGLFAFSFYTASLLVLYAAPVLLGFVLLRHDGRAPLPRIVGRYADVVLLPVAYWLVKSVFLTPSGLYVGYNALSGRSLAAVPGNLPGTVWQVLGLPLRLASDVAGPLGLVVGLALAAWLVRRGIVRRDPGSESRTLVSAPILALVGLVVLVLGVIPYLAVGRTPSIWDWSSRHQMLVPIGAGLIAAALARGLSMGGVAGRSVGVAVVGVLLGISAVADLRTLVAYQVDWFKQGAIVAAVRAAPGVADARHIEVVDNASRLNAMHRVIRFYEWNALFEQALGGTDRLVAPKDKGPAPELLDRFIARPGFHMSDYRPTPVDLTIEIRPADRIGFRRTANLLLLEWTGSPELASQLSGIVTLTPIPVTGSAP
jgi:hypothetical protein